MIIRVPAPLYLVFVRLCGWLVLLNGLITNGKFCCVRRLQLSLSWWHRPLRLRGSVLQSDVALAGEPDDPDLDRVPPARSALRRRAPVGSGLSAAGGVGRAGHPAYAGRALSNRTQVVPARNRKSAMLPVGPGQSHAPRPEEDWIAVPVPPVVSEEVFAQVQAKLDTNQQTALRNTRHEYLLRALVSCGKCGLSCVVRQTPASYRYYLCRGRTDGLRVAHGQRCTAPLHPRRTAR